LQRGCHPRSVGMSGTPGRSGAHWPRPAAAAPQQLSRRCPSRVPACGPK
jgi:hypothetical protein